MKSIPQNKKVTFLVPCYNVEKYVRQAIESIITQSYTNLEILLIDDGSTDNTLSILKEYAEIDHRIKIVINEKNIGLIKTLNKGVLLSTGDFIARFDADDLITKTRIETQINIAKENPQIDLISSFLKFISINGQILGDVTFFNCSTFPALKFKCLFETPIPHPGLFIKSDILKNYLYEDKPTNYYIEDYDLFTKLIRDNVKIYIDTSDSNKYLYRINPTSISNSYKIAQIQNAINKSKENIRIFLNYEVQEDVLTVISLNYNSVWDYKLLLKSIAVFKKIKVMFLYKEKLNNSEISAINTWYNLRTIRIYKTAFYKGNILCKITVLLLIIKNISIFFNKSLYISIYNFLLSRFNNI